VKALVLVHKGLLSRERKRDRKRDRDNKEKYRERENKRLRNSNKESTSLSSETLFTLRIIISQCDIIGDGHRHSDHRNEILQEIDSEVTSFVQRTY
jgi:hypothetical protein